MQNTRLLECDTVYGVLPGKGSRRYFTGLGRGFYGYRFSLPATQLLFSSRRGGADSPTIDSKTNEGASVTAELSLQYQLPRDAAKMCELTYKYGSDLNPFFIAVRRRCACCCRRVLHRVLRACISCWCRVVR